MNMMIDAKQQICEWIDIDKNSLNDISLEDVEMSEYARENVETATLQMTVSDTQELAPVVSTHLACKSYWVEHTKELVLFMWNASQTKTIVIPEEGWMLRDDITIH